MRSLGVEIGLAKSIVSEKGIGLEFAKKTFIKGEEISPVPFKEASAAHRGFSVLRTFADKYDMDTLSILRFLGYGYRIDPSKLGSRILRVLRVVFSIPRNPAELEELFMFKQIYDNPKDSSFTSLTEPREVRKITRE